MPLMPIVADTPDYKFLFDNRETRRVLLASRVMIDAGGGCVPLWYAEFDNAQEQLAVLRWLGLRQDRHAA